VLLFLTTPSLLARTDTNIIMKGQDYQLHGMEEEDEQDMLSSPQYNHSMNSPMVNNFYIRKLN
jgi:hypothetical protein